MSGIEVAGLVFGVLPIIIEVVKSYKDITKTARTLRHYSKEIKSIAEQLKVHNGIFLNEVRLLLRSIEEEEEVESMLSDAADQRWVSKSLNDKLRTVLRESFEICCGIIEETNTTIELMTDEMRKFDVLLDQRKKGESLKATLRRLNHGVRISFDKSRHEHCLACLRDRNGDLSALRSQIGAFQRQSPQKISGCIQHKPLPKRLDSVQNASQKLHEALCLAWCCDDPAHRGHYAKLCVDVQATAELRLDLAISCHEPAASKSSTSSVRPPIWLYVQSMSTSAHMARPQTIIAPSPCATAMSPLISRPLSALKKRASVDLQQTSSRKKAKQVQFINVCSTSGASPTAPILVNITLTSDFDLCRSKSICTYLQKHYERTTQAAAERCVGYLESPHLYRHLFFFREHRTPGIRDISNPSQRDNVYSLYDVMNYEADDALTAEDQLRLAHKTATALLQFSGTPWLSERWRLRDLCYFGSEDSLDDASLKTLHLSSEISPPETPTPLTTAMDGIEQAVSDQLLYGINNMALFFLGVALIEIAHWKPIEQKMTSRDLNQEVLAARRLAAGRAPLGPHYQKIAEKCLRCDFGMGTNLRNEGLQRAVYNSVVCELEGMIEKLTI